MTVFLFGYFYGANIYSQHPLIPSAGGFKHRLPMFQNGFLVYNVHIPLGAPRPHKTHLMYELNYMEMDQGPQRWKVNRALNPEPLNSCPDTWKNSIVK